MRAADLKYLNEHSTWRRSSLKSDRYKALFDLFAAGNIKDIAEADYFAVDGVATNRMRSVWSTCCGTPIALRLSAPTSVSCAKSVKGGRSICLGCTILFRGIATLDQTNRHVRSVNNQCALTYIDTTISINFLRHEYRSGYEVKRFDGSTKRYVRYMELRDTPELFSSEYERRHAQGNVWPEVLEGIRAVGILEMEIYRLRASARDDSGGSGRFRLGRGHGASGHSAASGGWEAYMAEVQEAFGRGHLFGKWRRMDRIFNLY